MALVSVKCLCVLFRDLSPVVEIWIILSGMFCTCVCVGGGGGGVGWGGGGSSRDLDYPLGDVLYLR